MLKLANRGHKVIRMHGGYASKEAACPDPVPSNPNSANPNPNPANPNPNPVNHGVNLFADAQVPSFFRLHASPLPPLTCFRLIATRRLTFSPDGLLLLTPTGIHRPPETLPPSTGLKHANLGPKSFCTHVFSRFSFSTPCLSLVGLDDPSVAVRCCPLLFRPLLDDGKQMMIPGDYRFLTGF